MQWYLYPSNYDNAPWASRTYVEITGNTETHEPSTQSTITGDHAARHGHGDVEICFRYPAGKSPVAADSAFVSWYGPVTSYNVRKYLLILFLLISISSSLIATMLTSALHDFQDLGLTPLQISPLWKAQTITSWPGACVNHYLSPASAIMEPLAISSSISHHITTSPITPTIHPNLQI